MMRATALLLFGLGACAHHGDMVSAALRHEGRTARELGLPRSLWCADFANLVRREAGFRAPVSRRAIDQSMHARRIARPVPGALQITRRRGGGNHVDLVVKVHADRLTVIGGNIRDGSVPRVVMREVPIAGIFVKPL